MPDPIERWHAYMRAGDVALLDGMIAQDAVFRSPAVHTPQVGKAITVRYLTAAAQVLGNPSFRYTGEWRAAGERSAVLEFACEVGGKQIEGVDIIRWNEAGLIDDFRVMVRPLKGLQAVIEAMAARLGVRGREAGMDVQERFERRNLAGADFTDCRLTGATFRDIALDDASFDDVTFAGTRFHNINLSGVTITDANIAGLTIDGHDIAALIAAERARSAG